MNSAPDPRIAISTACLAGTLDDKLAAAAAAGFTRLELLEHDLVMSAWSPRRLAEEAAQRGLTIEAYQPFRVEATPAARFPATLRRAERKLELLSQLGARVLVCCATRTADGIDDDDLAADQLGSLAALAGAHGIRLAYEALPWGRLSAHQDALRVVERVDHPALGLCLDSFHLLSPANDASLVDGVPVDRVFHVQLADAVRPNLDVREWSLHHRMFPGQGALDVSGFLARLLAAGYAGPMALEVFNDVYQQEDPRHAATDAMRSLSVLGEALAARGVQDLPTWLGASADLPPAPALTGFGFAELALDEVSAPLVSRTLTALGFAHVGQHRTKPVQLWEQGGAAILLNLAPERSIPPATASIAALAFDSADPQASLSRAERMLAPRLARRRAADETDLASVAAPDGTALFFCAPSDRPSWREDFEPTGTPPNRSPVLTRIDHVSVTESVDDFDQSALFVRSVLGLLPGEASEVTAPFGVIRGWSASDPGRRVRLSLSTTALRRGDWSPGVTSPQVIAFEADDAYACARQLRERGAPILEMPDNYYDDLDARLALPGETLAQLREYSILFDRDQRGEYLHFFTEMIGSRLIFEVVQRVGGYDRLGDPESVPLRMAAHRRQRLRMFAVAPTAPGAAPQVHQYSLAHLTALSLSPPELVDAAAAAGYRYVGLRMTKVTTQEPYYPLPYDAALMRATRTHLAATGIEVLDVELARMTSGDSPRDYLRFLEAGAELGARHVITQLPDADFGRKTERFATLCELARPLGLTIDLEFPSWTETPNLTEAVRVLRAADQPNAGLLVDVLHFARSGSSLAELRDLPREWFHYAHVCDAPAEIPGTTAGLIHTARFERLFPGDGGLDVRGILGALPAGVPYALEIPHAPLVASVGAKEYARLAIDASRRHLDAAMAVPA